MDGDRAPIEEIVAITTKEMEEELLRLGKDAAQQAIRDTLGLPPYKPGNSAPG